MKKTYVALTLCIAMLTTGCGAAAKPAATETDMARNVSSDTPDITVEQVINEYNSARRAVSAEAAENDMYAPLSVMSCVCRAKAILYSQRWKAKPGISSIPPYVPP